jgi:hypothetical protein
MSVFPVYLFERRHEDEVEAQGALLLAGELFYNAFGKRPKRRGWLEIEEIIRGLTADAKTGRLPDVVIGWPGSGERPPNAVDTNEEALMAPWFDRAFKVEVRCSIQSAALGVSDDARVSQA